MNSELNGISGLSRVSKVSWTRGCLASALAVASVLGWSASAQAGVYNVYTNSQSGNAAMARVNDSFCSLAEAIDSVNAGSPQGGCVDTFPGSGAIIQFWEGSGRPFAANHFGITSLTITRDVMLVGSGAYIDSTGSSGLVIGTNASVEISGLTLTYTGTNGGRLIRNHGELAIFDSTLRWGNVSALAGTAGYGGAIYNTSTGFISFVDDDVSIEGNTARRGGGIYNSTGTIAELRGNIVSNTATLAGGGIYNQSTTGIDGAPDGRIIANGAAIIANSAKSGGGVFNRGEFYVTGTYITLNSASGTGSGETTPAGQSLDGAGGGIVSTPYSSAFAALFNTSENSSISANTASGYGGGVYNAGQANLVGVTISDNRALSGAALYSVPQGFFYYCQIGGSGTPAVINNNILHATGSGRYSILDGLLLGTDDARKCSIATNTTASGNSAPRYCRSSMVRTSDGSSVCPQ